MFDVLWGLHVWVAFIYNIWILDFGSFLIIFKSNDFRETEKHKRSKKICICTKTFFHVLILENLVLSVAPT